MNKTHSKLSGKKITLIISDAEKIGDNEDCRIFTGIVTIEDKKLFFSKKKANIHFEILEEWIERIKPVPADVRDILNNADICLSLLIGNLTEGTNTDHYIKTGLKWN